jgi:hypothetical protein
MPNISFDITNLLSSVPTIDASDLALLLIKDSNCDPVIYKDIKNLLGVSRTELFPVQQ